MLLASHMDLPGDIWGGLAPWHCLVQLPGGGWGWSGIAALLGHSPSPEARLCSMLPQLLLLSIGSAALVCARPEAGWEMPPPKPLNFPWLLRTSCSKGGWLWWTCAQWDVYPCVACQPMVGQDALVHWDRSQVRRGRRWPGQSCFSGGTQDVGLSLLGNSRVQQRPFSGQGYPWYHLPLPTALGGKSEANGLLEKLSTLDSLRGAGH